MKNQTLIPVNYPGKTYGKLTTKIVMKNDYVRTDGTSALYLQIFLNSQRLKIPLQISTSKENFDLKKQRIKPGDKFYKDYNLLIEKLLSDINRIEVNYRLAKKELSIQALIDEMNNPDARLNFIEFWKLELKNQIKIIRPRTYLQQVSSLNKIMKFQNPVYFNDINEKFVTDLRYFFKTKMNNCPATINTTIKALKKYVHIANKQGILTPIPYSEIKTKQFLGNRAFLMPLELVKLKDYYSSSFIKESYKNILSRFMFCCFTGLRLSDMRALTLDSFSENVLFFTAEKTTKIQRIKMNKSAMLFVGEKKVFEGNYTDQHINRELKEIATIVGITKKLSFHVSRHTFATNFLISGGRVEHLQKILGHSKITETMIYVNIVDQITDTQINNLDDIFGL